MEPRRRVCTRSKLTAPAQAAPRATAPQASGRPEVLSHPLLTAGKPALTLLAHYPHQVLPPRSQEETLPKELLQSLKLGALTVNHTQRPNSVTSRLMYREPSNSVTG